ncbi:hypothetical protein VTN00DRAFT_2662 [Thermoascus crustaceus]|uniref:uncharacterized protein n=1 Tax=Thermoascus crustaceus TaxID=5088 RepID=UPI00374338E3
MVDGKLGIDARANQAERLSRPACLAAAHVPDAARIGKLSERTPTKPKNHRRQARERATFPFPDTSLPADSARLATNQRGDRLLARFTRIQVQPNSFSVTERPGSEEPSVGFSLHLPEKATDRRREPVYVFVLRQRFRTPSAAQAANFSLSAETL